MLAASESSVRDLDFLKKKDKKRED